MTNLIDVIIRFHDIRRIYELERAVFSVLGQSYRPINIILSVQRFSDKDVEQVNAMMNRLLSDDDSITFKIAPWNHSEPRDGRSALMSMGMRQCRGRYMAFLDYDDTLYPEAYDFLVESMLRNDAAISFASLRILEVDVFQDFLYARGVRPFFNGNSLRDLLRSNFCPIHSFAVDRSKIPESYLYFDSAITIEEDYDFLLRVCSAFKSDFSLIGKQIGDYIYKTDGSNTVPAGHGVKEGFLEIYQNTLDFMDARRRLIYLSKIVLESEGISSSAMMTIEQFLNLDQSKKLNFLG